MKRLISFAFASAISCAPFVNAHGDELNPFVEVDPSLINIPAGSFDYYPLAWGGPQWFSYFLVSCITNANCFFDVCAIPAGTTTVNCSFDNLVPGRGLRVYDASQDITGLKGTIGQVLISSPGGSVGASTSYVFAPNGGFAIENLPNVIDFVLHLLCLLSDHLFCLFFQA